MSTKRALGTGLSALFGDTGDTEASSGELLYLPIERVEPRSDQPRKDFDPVAMEELTDSVRRYGLIQPITVRPLDGGYYQIIAGERRWRASRAAGLREVPVRVLENTGDQLTAELALVENLQRSDLNPLEEAEGLRQLMELYGLTQEEAAARVGKSRPAVANALRLLKLPESVRSMVEQGTLSAGHARALLPLGSGDELHAAARHVVDAALSVRQTESFVARLLRSGTENEKSPDARPGTVDYRREAEKQLSQRLGRAVRISGGPGKGRITLDFYDPRDRDALLDALMRLPATQTMPHEHE